jgi:hypothetical protein
MILAAMGLLLLGSGCGGITGKYSVSPASFLIPGLMKNDKPAMGPTNTVYMAQR